MNLIKIICFCKIKHIKIKLFIYIYRVEIRELFDKDILCSKITKNRLKITKKKPEMCIKTVIIHLK